MDECPLHIGDQIAKLDTVESDIYESRSDSLLVVATYAGGGGIGNVNLQKDLFFSIRGGRGAAYTQWVCETLQFNDLKLNDPRKLL